MDGDGVDTERLVRSIAIIVSARSVLLLHMPLYLALLLETSSSSITAQNGAMAKCEIFLTWRTRPAAELACALQRTRRPGSAI